MKNNLIVDCLIPARGGSKGIPKKNIKPLGGHPLIAYSIIAAKLSKNIRRVIVTTDNQEIANIAEKYGAEILYLRPKELAQDDSTDIDFFKYHVKHLKDNHLEVPDLFVHLRPTTPLRNPAVIDDAIEKFKQDKNATALRSLNLIQSTPYKMFRRENGYIQPFLKSDLGVEFYNMPRQVFEDAYEPNGYVDIVQTHFFMNGTMLHGEKIILYETENNVDIDTIDDFKSAEVLLKEEKNKDILKYLERFE